VALGKIGVFNKGMRCFRNQPTIPKVFADPRSHPTLTPPTTTYHKIKKTAPFQTYQNVVGGRWWWP
jgi:hypothetical protein